MQEISASVLSGKEIAAEIIRQLKSFPKPPGSLVAVLVGDSPESKSFLKQKEKVALELGIEFQIRQFRENISEIELLGEIQKLSEDNQVAGIILQLPLPAGLSREKIISAINSKKDVDGLTGAGRGLVNPPAVEVVRDILEFKNFNLKDSVVSVVGSSGFLVGQPLSEWLNGKCKKLIKVDVADDLSQIGEADFVVSGVGKSGLIKPEMLKHGAAVIDFGYSVVDGKISGDFLASNTSSVSWYTPTPGGTGSILVAELFRNYFKLNKKTSN